MANTVLVTGGAGYIGSHTCKALAKSGWIPVVFDNLSLGRADAVRWGPTVVGDTRDEVSVTSALQEHGSVAVIHFAARSSVGESMADPMLYYDNNVGGLIGVLAGMRATGCDAMVFSSSAAIYGEPENSPIRETAKAKPISP